MESKSSKSKMSQRVAALDLGSNSFLCLICDGTSAGIKQIVSDEIRLVRLGQGVDKNKKFAEEALERAAVALKDFRKLIDEHGVQNIKAVATSAARDASNREELFKIGSDLGIPIEIIDGQKEAEMTYKGSVFDQDQSRRNLIIDIGGGSTEIIFGSGQDFEFKKSLDIGCVRFAERYITKYPMPPQELERLIVAVCDELSHEEMSLRTLHANQIIAVAGTPTSLAAIELGGFDEEKVHGFEFSQAKLTDWVQRLASSSLEEKIKWGLPQQRADIIIVGVIILSELLKKLRMDKIKVSTKGVRYGLAMELLAQPSRAGERK